MKFNKGHWQLLPGTHAIHPISIVEVLVEPERLLVRGFSKEVKDRADLIDGAVITACFTSPMPGAVRVQLFHHKGRAQEFPVFDLDYSLTNSQVTTGENEHHAWLDTGKVRLCVPRTGTWQYNFERDGRLLTASEPNAVGLMEQGGEIYLREQLSLGIDEIVYGLGERFGPLERNGQAVEIWNEDGGTDSELAYKNVPFYLTSRGVGVLVNHPGRVSFEVASHHVNRVQFSVRGHALDYYLFGGDTPKAVLEQYSTLSGRPAMPPAWSFGLWLSTSFTASYDEASIMKILQQMEQLDIPVSVIHFDCFWMKELTWSSLIWDRRNFPDPEGMLKRIRERGVRVCVWINPYISESSPLFDEGRQNGYLLKDLDGNPYQTDLWQPGMGLVDFTNPRASDWFCGKLEALVQMGVDSFKTDFGERIPVDVRYHDGSDPERMHNYYSYLYNRSVFETLERVKGKGQAVLFARSATCGGQKFPAHWSGDCSSTYASMAETLRGGLSLGLTGFGFWSHDISGFIGKASPNLYKRWVAFGLLCSHSRLHGMDSPRLPWLYDEEAVDVLRYFLRLKRQLAPYLMDTAREACEHGWPMLRAMVLEYPDDHVCHHLGLQYMLGPALLVAPIFNEEGEVTVYLPAGNWRHLLTGELASGPAWRNELHGPFSLPLWVSTERASDWECLGGSYR